MNPRTLAQVALPRGPVLPSVTCRIPPAVSGDSKSGASCRGQAELDRRGHFMEAEA
jgi:hypothetical protein